MDPDDLRNDPHRQVPRLGLSWSTMGDYGGGTTVGESKHYGSGGPEDERGMVMVSPQHDGRFDFYASHYHPWNRDHSDPDAGNVGKTGDFVVKSRHRAMVAGESLLRRLQLNSGGY